MFKRYLRTQKLHMSLPNRCDSAGRKTKTLQVHSMSTHQMDHEGTKLITLWQFVWLSWKIKWIIMTIPESLTQQQRLETPIPQLVYRITMATGLHRPSGRDVVFVIWINNIVVRINNIYFKIYYSIGPIRKSHVAQ